MPKKTCPQCKTSVGVRTLNCQCGYSFDSAKKAVPPKEKLNTAVKPAKDPAADLIREADDLSYSVKKISDKGPLRSRFFIRKTINGLRYEAIFTEAGKITGICEYA